MRTLLFILFIGMIHSGLFSQTQTSRFIRVDQMGYFCTSNKIAIIIDPVNGYDSGDSFTPGTGNNDYELRKKSNDETVFKGTLTAWNNGIVQGQSGDRGWYFDFTSFSVPGEYYIYDKVNNVRSYVFSISENCYDTLMYHSSRFYFYQRCNFAKNTPFAASNWTDAAAFERSNQDHHSRSRYAKNDPGSERDVSGGWFDAGDYNKYVTFALHPVCVLLDAYQKYPGSFSDHVNIPESGNGVADILDEVRFEIDWLKRMQDATGTGGLLIKVGVDTYNNTGSPPSTDANPRYYVPECTSSTIAGTAMMAHAAVVFSSIPAWTDYANDLKSRAESAWNRALVTTNNFTSFETGCDDQDIKSGDADQDEATQMQSAIVAAIYLFEANIGNGSAQTYKSFVESNYQNIDPIANGWWGPYNLHVKNALLHYTQLSGVNPTVSAAIKNSKLNSNTGMGIDEYNNKTDLYLAHMNDDQYHWGSALVKATLGVNMLNFVYYNLDPANNDSYLNAAEQYLHWFHGVNAQGVMLMTDMYPFGADSCINEVYHSWFADGTDFDNTKLSPYGPAPGFIPGGPNKNYSVPQVNPPYNQPPQKSYKDWNTAWNGNFQEESYTVTEVSIYGQAGYIALLAGILAHAPAPGTCEIPLAVNTLTFTAIPVQNNVLLRWEHTAAADVTIQRTRDMLHFTDIVRLDSQKNSFSDNGLLPGQYFYRLKYDDDAGQIYYSRTLSVMIESSSKLFMQYNTDRQSIQLENNGSLPISLHYKITAVSGNEIKSGTLMIQSQGKSSISLCSLPAGVYFCTLGDSYYKYSEKFIVP